VLVGERVISGSIVHALQMNNPSSATHFSAKAPANPKVVQVDSSELQGAAFEGFDFNQGKAFADSCLRKFRQRVNLDKFSRRNPFYLVCSFGRACFILDVHTVAIALQACFGGTTTLYNVKALRDRTFIFSASSSAIGFEIYNSVSYSHSSFKIFFNIYGQGGPN
jgi:hypothetical protein